MLYSVFNMLAIVPYVVVSDHILPVMTCLSFVSFLSHFSHAELSIGLGLRTVISTLWGWKI